MDLSPGPTPPQAASSDGERPAITSHGAMGAWAARFSVRRPVSICVVFICLLTLGLVSATRIPLVLLPKVEFPFVYVWIPYPNATPGQVQEAITRPLEEAFGAIPGLRRMSANSASDAASLELLFDSGRDTHLLRSQIRETVERLRSELPSDLEPIWVLNFSTDDIPILFCGISSDQDLRRAYELLDLRVKRRLERIPGVAEVELFGVVRPRVDVYLRADDLRRYGVRVDRLLPQLAAATRNYSLGSVDNSGKRHASILQGAVSSPREIEALPINVMDLRLGDIGDVEADSRLPPGGVHLNGNSAVGFAVRKASDANTVETVRRVLDEINAVRNDPGLAGFRMHIFHNAGEEITKSLSSLLDAGGMGALLAVAVLILFLRRLSVTLLVALTIPFCLIAAVGILYWSGFTLNVLSMMGLMLSAGMLVDNAIVVLESIYQKLEKGMDRESAAVLGAHEVTTAVVAATLTSIIVFVPLFFGDSTDFSSFFMNTGLAMVAAMLVSLFVSLTAIPLAMARFLRVRTTGRGRGPAGRLLATLAVARQGIRGSNTNPPGLWWTPWKTLRTGAGRGPRGIVALYLRTVAWPLEHRVLVGLILVPAVVGLSVWVLETQVPDTTADAEQRNSLRIRYEFLDNYHYLKIQRDFLRPVEQFLLASRDRFKISDVFSEYGDNRAHTDVYFDSNRVTTDEVVQIRAEIEQGLPILPGAEIQLRDSDFDQDEENWIHVDIHGEDPLQLNELAAVAQRRLASKTEFKRVRAMIDSSTKEVQIRLDRDLARTYGVSAEGVSGFLSIVARAAKLGAYATPQGEVEVWVQLRRGDLQKLDDVGSLVVGGGPKGEDILLSHVAKFELATIPSRIRREDRRTFVRVSAAFAGNLEDEGLPAVAEVMNSLDYPRGYGWNYAFATQERQRADRTFLFDFLLALCLVYLVMASLFESLAHPFAILLSLPFAVVGVAWFLLLTGTPFNVMAMIGMLLLVGVVVNNGIILVDHINHLRRSGLPRLDAIREGCRERFRPIVMTAATTIVGLIPLAWGESGLFGLPYFPMVRTVMGGLAASTVLTLIVLPTYYTLLDDFAVWLQRTWHASDPSLRRRPADAPASGD